MNVCRRTVASMLLLLSMACCAQAEGIMEYSGLPVASHADLGSLSKVRTQISASDTTNIELLASGDVKPTVADATGLLQDSPEDIAMKAAAAAVHTEHEAMDTSAPRQEPSQDSLQEDQADADAMHNIAAAHNVSEPASKGMKKEQSDSEQAISSAVDAATTVEKSALQPDTGQQKAMNELKTQATQKAILAAAAARQVAAAATSRLSVPQRSEIYDSVKDAESDMSVQKQALSEAKEAEANKTAACLKVITCDECLAASACRSDQRAMEFFERHVKEQLAKCLEHTGCTDCPGEAACHEASVKSQKETSKALSHEVATAAATQEKREGAVVNTTNHFQGGATAMAPQDGGVTTPQEAAASQSSVIAPETAFFSVYEGIREAVRSAVHEVYKKGADLTPTTGDNTVVATRVPEASDIEASQVKSPDAFDQAWGEISRPNAFQAGAPLTGLVSATENKQTAPPVPKEEVPPVISSVTKTSATVLKAEAEAPKEQAPVQAVPSSVKAVPTQPKTVRTPVKATQTPAKTSESPVDPKQTLAEAAIKMGNDALKKADEATKVASEIKQVENKALAASAKDIKEAETATAIAEKLKKMPASGTMANMVAAKGPNMKTVSQEETRHAEKKALVGDKPKAKHLSLDDLTALADQADAENEKEERLQNDAQRKAVLEAKFREEEEVDAQHLKDDQAALREQKREMKRTSSPRRKAQKHVAVSPKVPVASTLAPEEQLEHADGKPRAHPIKAESLESKAQRLQEEAARKAQKAHLLAVKAVKVKQVAKAKAERAFKRTEILQKKQARRNAERAKHQQAKLDAKMKSIHESLHRSEKPVVKDYLQEVMHNSNVNTVSNKMKSVVDDIDHDGLDEEGVYNKNFDLTTEHLGMDDVGDKSRVKLPPPVHLLTPDEEAKHMAHLQAVAKRKARKKALKQAALKKMNRLKNMRLAAVKAEEKKAREKKISVKALQLMEAKKKAKKNLDKALNDPLYSSSYALKINQEDDDNLAPAPDDKDWDEPNKLSVILGDAGLSTALKDDTEEVTRADEENFDGLDLSLVGDTEFKSLPGNGEAVPGQDDYGEDDAAAIVASLTLD